jgi:hypothetical protein
MAKMGSSEGFATAEATEARLTPSTGEVNPEPEAEELRDRVEHELRRAGFIWQGTRLVPPPGEPKEVARLLHSQQRLRVLERNRSFVETWEGRVLGFFAEGRELNPAGIWPSVRPVLTEEDAAIFRYASLTWSVPVSQGYGRRTRFLIWDESIGRLIGILAMGDPVYNLRVRDTVIGWDTNQRRSRLYNVFDAFVLGAVDPYRQLLAGKLVALTAVSEETIGYLAEKYRGTTTHIQKVEKMPRPVLVTTTSALGRSSIYNRIALDGRKVFTSTGFTEGFGHFQFSDQLFADLVRFVETRQTVRGNKYGDGPNWKIRTIRSALEALGLPGDLLSHGLKREVFLAPLGVGWRAFLRGETDRVGWYRYQLSELSKWYVERWAVPRAARRDDWTSYEPQAHRLSDQLLQPSD